MKFLMAVDNAPSSSTGPSSHRLKTVSASQALQDLEDKAAPAIKTGLKQLDTLLSDHAIPNNGNKYLFSPNSDKTIGLQPGTVTEIWGPSGSGKTTFAIQFCADALRTGESVTWCDLGAPLHPSRLEPLLSNQQVQNLNHLSLSTLSHLLVFLSHPPSYLPPSSLLIIENLHHAIETAYPRSYPSPTASEAMKWASSRRVSVLGFLVSALRKLALVHDLAVVLTSNAGTRARGYGEPAVLVPLLSGAEWERGIQNRIVLFRDFGGEGDGIGRQGRYIGVTKVNGWVFAGEDGDVGIVVRFGISEKGILDPLAQAEGQTVEHGSSSLPTRIVSPVKSRTSKRKIDEVGDSDDEGISEYGWDDGDEVAAEGLIDEEDLFAPEGDTEPEVVNDVIVL